MSLLRSLSDGLRSLFRKERADGELGEEVRGFLEMAAEEKMKEGMRRRRRCDRCGWSEEASKVQRHPPGAAQRCFALCAGIDPRGYSERRCCADSQSNALWPKPNPSWGARRCHRGVGIYHSLGQLRFNPKGGAGRSDGGPAV